MTIMTSRQDKNRKLSNNTQVLKEAQRVQSKTRQSLLRIQQQAAETEVLGGETLQELHSQRQQLHNIDKESKKLHAHLDKSKKLQNTMDRWALNWRGTHKRQAKKDAKFQMKLSKISQESSAFKYPATTHKQAKPLQKKNDILLVTDDDTDSPRQPLDHEDQQALDQIENDDAEIDAMLDATSDALDRLDRLALEMKEESQAHYKVIDKHDESITKAHTKQQVLNGRMKRMLGR